ARRLRQGFQTNSGQDRPLGRSAAGFSEPVEPARDRTTVATDRRHSSMSVARRLVAEMLGTALLLAVVVGSGIMGERLAGGNVAIALLANSLATGFGLVALIVAFAPRSGAHFNPLVTLAFALRAGFPARRVLPYLAAQ